MDVREVTRFKPDMMLKPAMVQEGRFSGNSSSSFYAFLKEKSHLVFTFPPTPFPQFSSHSFCNLVHSLLELDVSSRSFFDKGIVA